MTCIGFRTGSRTPCDNTTNVLTVQLLAARDPLQPRAGDGRRRRPRCAIRWNERKPASTGVASIANGDDDDDQPAISLFDLARARIAH